MLSPPLSPDHCTSDSVACLSDPQAHWCPHCSWNAMYHQGRGTHCLFWANRPRDPQSCFPLLLWGPALEPTLVAPFKTTTSIQSPNHPIFHGTCPLLSHYLFYFSFYNFLYYLSLINTK